jgi:hypothetical protein
MLYIPDYIVRASRLAMTRRAISAATDVEIIVRSVGHRRAGKSGFGLGMLKGTVSVLTRGV